MATLNCVMHACPIIKIYTGAIFFSLLGSTAAHALTMTEDADISFALKLSESLGEAASLTELQKEGSATSLPDIDKASLELKLSESCGEVAPLTTSQTSRAVEILHKIDNIPVELKLSESLGEAAFKAASGENGATAILPQVDNTPIALKMSESLGAVAPQTALKTDTAQPAVSSSTAPVAVTHQAIEMKKHTTDKQPTVRQTAQAETAPDDGPRFGIAPIRWGGDVSENLRWRRYTTGDGAPAMSTLDNMQMINLRASSYIWQPWIATVNGGIGLLHSIQSTSSSSSSASNTLTGNGGLSLFPRSRFPFNASYDVSDSRTSTSLNNSSGDYSSKRLGLQQNYRTPSGDSSVTVDFSRSVLTSSSFGDDIVSSLKGAYSTKLSTSQTAGMTLLHTESSQQGGNSGLNLNGFTAQHSYRSDSQLTVDTSASLTDTVWNTQSLGVTSSSSSRYLQAGTSANWRPDEDKPLYINGGLRFFDGSSKYAGAVSNTQSVSGNVMASYNPTHNLALSASGNVTRVDSSGVSSLTTTQSGNASYNGDVIKFGKNISYNWNIGGNLSNQTSNNSTNDQRVAGTASHTLYYPYLINNGSALNFSATQAMSSSYDKIYGMSDTLIHNGTISWSAPRTESLNGTANLSVGDTHTFGYNESNYQFANLHIDGRKQYSLNSSLGINAGLNWDRQGLTGRTTTGANISASYQHSRAFNVRGLRYSIIGNVNTTSYNERLLGDVNAQRTQSGYSIDQSLNYRIGRLDTSLTASLSRFNDRDNASIYVRIGRFFGNM